MKTTKKRFNTKSLKLKIWDRKEVYTTHSSTFVFICSGAWFMIKFFIFVMYMVIFLTLWFLAFFFHWGSGLLILLTFQCGDLQFIVLTALFYFWYWTLIPLSPFLPAIWASVITTFRAHSFLTLRIFFSVWTPTFLVSVFFFVSTLTFFSLWAPWISPPPPPILTPRSSWCPPLPAPGASSPPVLLFPVSMVLLASAAISVVASWSYSSAPVPTSASLPGSAVITVLTFS